MGTPRINNPNKGTEEDNEEVDTSLHPVRSTWTRRTIPSPRSLLCLSDSSPGRTRLKTATETPATTRSTTEAVETIVTSKPTDVRDLLVVLVQNENETTDHVMKSVGAKDVSIENETIDLVTEITEEEEEKDTPLLKVNRQAGRIRDLPPILNVANKDTTIIMSNARISKDATSAGVVILFTSVQTVSFEKHLPQTCRRLPRVHKISQTGFIRIGANKGTTCQKAPLVIENSPIKTTRTPKRAA